ncbi:MAG: glycosyltransferase family 2 protein [Deltaproteobacteria bacterium]
MTLSTPVALLLFNRPATTARVFEAIRAARPARLLVVADGPRADRAGEAELCREARSVVDRVDWPCEVETDFSAVNLGCRKRLSSGLDWVFSRAEEAIVLEDDCLPHPTFFRYCEELLVRYRDDERVMFLSGSNFHFGRRFGPYSYFPSRYPHVWGWASWRRAWSRYDVTMSRWPELRDQGWPAKAFPRSWVRRFWEQMYEKTWSGTFDTWDYQLAFACHSSGGLSLTPAVNLVANIGFGPDGTRTRRPNRFAEMPVEAMTFPLLHPPDLTIQADADRAIENAQFLVNCLPVRVTRAFWKVTGLRPGPGPTSTGRASGRAPPRSSGG